MILISPLVTRKKDLQPFLLIVIDKQTSSAADRTQVTWQYSDEYGHKTWHLTACVIKQMENYGVKYFVGTSYT